MTSPHPTPRFSPPQRWLMMGLLTVMIAGVAATLGVIMGRNPQTQNSQTTVPADGPTASPFTPNTAAYRLTRPVNILVMGIDPEISPDLNGTDAPETQFNGRSDTLLLVRFEPSTPSVNVLSIPRDTQVDIPDVGRGKINEAHYWGGIETTLQVVQDSLNQVPIDRYIRVSHTAFQEWVDLLGGVEIFIPQPMVYTDQTQQLTINLAPGWQTLNGEQAEQFARFRSDGQGDLGRVQRQQILLDAIQRRLKQPTLIPRLPQLLRVLQKYVDTDLTFEEILTLANLGLKLDQSQFKMVILPGEGDDLNPEYTSYWYIDEFERDRILHQYFNQDSNRYLLDSFARETQDQDFPFNLKIAIQNASGRPQREQQVLEYLEQQGFYNAYLVEDWPDPQRQTQIIAQQGDLKSAKFLKNLLDQGQIQATSTGVIGSELTLRIGQDWQVIP